MYTQVIYIYITVIERIVYVCIHVYTLNFIMSQCSPNISAQIHSQVNSSNLIGQPKNKIEEIGVNTIGSNKWF